MICSFAFKLRPDYKINLVLTGLSIVFTVYLVEIVLFYGPSQEKLRRAERLQVAKGISFDTRKAREVIKDMKKGGVDAVRVFAPTFLVEFNGLEREGKRIFPLSGLSRKTTVLCNENGEWAIYESDEHGFNNPTGLYEGQIDTVLVGDSFTAGECVRQREDIASQLRMSGIRVLNLGSVSSGTLVEFAILKEYAEPKQPKYVFWMYYEGNDLKDLRHEQQSSFLLKYRDNMFSQQLIKRQPEIDFLLENLKMRKWQWLKYNLLRRFKLNNLRNRLALVIPPSPPLSLFTELLEKARNLTSSWGGQLYFVYLPSWARYAKEVEPGTFHYRNRVLSIVQRLNIPIIDIHEKAFVTHPDPLSLFPFRLNGHYTSEAYRLVAQAIHTHLVTVPK